MGLFKKKESKPEGGREWEQTLVAEDEPDEGEKEFRFQFGKPDPEDESPPEEETTEGTDEDFLEGFGEGPSETPEEDPHEHAEGEGTDRDAEDALWGDEDAPPALFRTGEPATPVQHTPEQQPEIKVVQERKWMRRHHETIAEIGRTVDRLVVQPRKRPKHLDRWTGPRDGATPFATPGEGMELIPPNIISKRICYETEGGFVVEVQYREMGDVFTRFYTISSRDGRRKALASMRSGTYAKVTTVTDDMIEKLKTPARRKKGQKRLAPGKVNTWPILNSVNVTDIEGIGDEYQARLKEIGFYTTDQLRLGNPKILSSHVGVTEAAVRQWQQQAELMLVKGVGKQLAELLVRAGVHSIDDLRGQTPKQLAKMIKEVRTGRKVRIAATGVGPKRAQTLIRTARTMRKRLQPFPELGPRK